MCVLFSRLHEICIRFLCDCCNDLPWMKCLKTKQIYYLTVLAGGSLKRVSMDKKKGGVLAGLCSFWMLYHRALSPCLFFFLIPLPFKGCPIPCHVSASILKASNSQLSVSHNAITWILALLPPPSSFKAPSYYIGHTPIMRVASLRSGDQ